MPKAARERMIEAAERLFAQRGIAAVSLREIRAATGQRNTAAVHYHFGSKARLIDAILEHRMDRLNQRRLSMLADLERDGRADDLRALVEAAVYPLAESLKPGSYYARFLAQAMADPVHGHALTVEPVWLEVREGMRRVDVRLRRLLRRLPPAIRRQRLVTAATMWVQTLAAHERELQSKRRPALPTATLASDLVGMIVAMLSAPLPPQARAGELRPRRARPRPPRLEDEEGDEGATG